MLTIRLQRKGKRNQPFFKIVVTEEKKSSTGGRFVEELGFYNPLTKERSLKGERAKYWLSVGAQPSDTVHNMLVADKVIEGKKRPQHKTPKQSASAHATGQESKKEQEEATTATTPETPSEQPSAPEQPKEAEESKQETSSAVDDAPKQQEPSLEPAPVKSEHPRLTS